MTYEAYSNATRSQKMVLAHLHAKEKLKLFTSYLGGDRYYRSVDHYVTGVTCNGVEMEGRIDNTLNDMQFYYDATGGVLWLKVGDGINPKTCSIYVTYRFFYSNLSANLPADISSGIIVPYDSRIKAIGALKLELDYENTGIAIESSSSVSLENNDGELDPIFDTLIWENNEVSFWSWNKSLEYDESKLIYRGLIDSKSFSPAEVKFGLKDELTRLKANLPAKNFSGLDGDIDSSLDGTAKRIIFGRVDKIRTAGIDKTLEGYDLTGTLTGSADRNLLTGTVSGVAGASTVTGSGTTFTTQLTAGDEVRIYSNLIEYKFTVNVVTNNTSFTTTSPIGVGAGFSGLQIRNLEVENNIVDGTGTDFLNEVSVGDELIVDDQKYEVEEVASANQLILGSEIETTFTAATIPNLPSIPYRKKNRRWHIAGHKLREYSLEITEVINDTNLRVDDSFDIEPGDFLEIEGLNYIVLRVSSNVITLNQAVPGSVDAGDILTKRPVFRAYVGGQEFVIERDFQVENTDDDAILVMDDLAEFNVTPAQRLTIQFGATSGSRNVTASIVDTDLATILKPRDWIKFNSINHPDWYEILDVAQDSLTLRSSAIVTYSGTFQVKRPTYIDDDSLVTVDCFGLDYNDSWVRYPADVVRYLLSESDLDNVNEESFDTAREDCPFLMSLYYPANFGGDIPNIREIIGDVNQSIFGSFVLDSDFNYTYAVLNADKPEDLEIIKDDDIINFSVTSKTNIYNTIALEYSPYVDTEAQNETFQKINLTSDFVNEAVGKVQELKVTCYLYKYDDALTIAQRWLFFRSLTQSVVTINAKLNLTLKALNDKIHISLTRLYQRFGGGARTKIGVINSITKDGSSTVIQVNDLGNIYNRVPAIAPDDSEDYADVVEDIAKWGYVLDNDTETPDVTTEIELGTNLIG